MPAKRKPRALVNTSAATDASLAVRIPELSPKLRAKALRLFALGHSRNAVARKLGVERAQVRAARAQRNHITCALRAFLRLEQHRLVTGLSWWAAKMGIIREAIRTYRAAPRYTLSSTA